MHCCIVCGKYNVMLQGYKDIISIEDAFSISFTYLIILETASSSVQYIKITVAICY